MPNALCPNCGADIDEDVQESTGRSACPTCGTAVDPELFRARTDVEPAGNAYRAEHAAELIPPGKSRIQVIEHTPERLLLFIPPGGKGAAGIGVFAVIWNAFMTLFTFFFVQAGNDVPWPAMGVIGLFWVVGLGMAFFWVKARFTRTYVLLSREMAAVQTVLFGRRKVRETQLGPHSSARLVMSYKQNDQPVYAVEVKGADDAVKFGTVLSEGEKEWLVDSINAFLGLPAEPTGSAAAGGPLVDVAPPVEIAPSELPESSMVRILDAPAGELSFELPAFPPGASRIIATAIGCGVAMFWMFLTLDPVFDILRRQPQVFDWIGAIVGGVFALVGLVPFSFGLFALRGKITVQIREGVLRCRWHLGLIGKSKQMPVASIQRVTVRVLLNSDRRNASGRGPNQNVMVCVVEGAGEKLPLTTYHNVETARQVAGLVRYQLREMGHPLPEEPQNAVPSAVRPAWNDDGAV